jgi:holin-like protein
MKLARALVQVAVLSLAYAGCDRLSRALELPVSGGVLGAVALAALLLSGALPLRWFEDGAELLLKYLGLFFVPASVAAMRQHLTARSIALLALVSAATTVLVLVITGVLAARGARE